MTIQATVDAHVHFWRYRPEEFDWIDQRSVLARDHLPDQLRPSLIAAGIASAIAVQARSCETETAWLLELAGQHDWIAGVVGWLDLAADDLAARIATYRALGPLVGLRHIVQDEAEGFLARSSIIKGVRTTLATGLVYEILVRAHQLPELPRFLDDVGEGALILDHGAKPPIAEGVWQPWADGIARVASVPHVYCKISGLVTEQAYGDCDPKLISRYIAHLLDCFGPERLIYGSDWPVCQLAADYTDTHAIVRDFVERECADHLDAIFGGNARRAYGSQTFSTCKESRFD